MRYSDLIVGNQDIKPVIDEAKLAAAEADGFDTSRLWYHGTRAKANFTKFKIPMRERNGAELGRGVYVTKYPGTANVWAQGQGTVLACVLREGKLFEMSKLNKAAIWFSGPDADDRHADPMWREIYRGYGLYMEREFGPGSTPSYRDFAERLNRHQIEYSTCLQEVGYIGITSRYSQISGQAVIWNPDDVRIVGRGPGFEGWSYDPDDTEDRAEREAYKKKYA